MDLKDLAALTGKSIDEVKKMLDEQEVLEVSLTERGRKPKKEEDVSIEVV